MLTFIAITHLVITVVLITLILLQDSKGGAMGVLGGGGGGSNTVFGSTGAASFLTKATNVVAILFALTCFALAYMTGQKSDSVFDGAPSTTINAPAEAGANKSDTSQEKATNETAAGAAGAESATEKADAAADAAAGAASETKEKVKDASQEAEGAAKKATE